MSNIDITDLSATQSFAYNIASSLKPGDVLFLFGDIGVGKSAFVSFFLKYHNIEYDGSPTFGLVHEYQGHRVRILHADCYRISELPIEFYDAQDAILLIEWPNEKVQKFFPNNISLFFKFADTRTCFIVKNNITTYLT